MGKHLCVLNYRIILTQPTVQVILLLQGGFEQGRIRSHSGKGYSK